MRSIRLAVLAVFSLSVAVASAVADVAIDELIQETGLREGPVAMRDFPGWRPPKRIVVWQVDGIDFVPEQDTGIEFVVVSSADALIAAAPGADAVFGWCSTNLVEAASNAVWIQVYSAGVDSCIDADRIASGRVVVTNMQKMSSPTIGEHAVAMSMALARNLDGYTRQMASGVQRRSDAGQMVSLDGKTMLVLGLGGIGTEAARRGAAIGMTVLGTRNSSREGPEFVSYVGLADEMLELAGRADVIVNALPLTDTTAGLLDEDFFTAVKPGAIFVNVGRGGTVVTDDLVEALISGQLGGAGLDVTDPEPLPEDHPLWAMDNVIITPHIAGAGGSRDRHVALARENLRRFIAGDKLLNVVDPERGY